MPQPFTNAATWLAPRAQTEPRLAAPRLIVPPVRASEWKPLRQFWRPGGVEPNFQPGWARIAWQPEWLFYEAIFLGGGARNRARALNERTWELGDIGEIFVALAGGPGYVELHVTPENQRLQLLWRPGQFGKFQADQRTFAENTVANPDWVRSAVFQNEAGWSVGVILPAAIFGVERLAPTLSLRTAVCRYDCAARAAPVLSSTAALTAPSYHRRDEWHSLALQSTAAAP